MDKSVTAQTQREKSDGHAPTTSACDQCRARKVRCNRQQPKCQNCVKAESDCTFSGRPNRVNHTRKLVDDFSSLEARLESIDHSVATISQRLSSAPQTPTLGTNSPEIYQNELFYSEKQSQKSDAENKSSQRQEAYRPIHRKFDDRGGERYYGSTAALSLIESSRRILGDILGSSESKNHSSVCDLVTRDHLLQTELQHLFDSFPFLESCQEPDFSVDGKAVCHPPRSYINSVLDTYLDTIHITRPVFQETCLRSAIEQHNAGDDVEPIEATNLCFNNIIILTLGLKLRQRRCREPDSHGMDDDLLLSFLKNSRRAFGHLRLFLEPRLGNVQALITLAMVAREYWESHVFDLVCHLACHVAKSMGLQRRPANYAGFPAEVNDLRTRLFWVLYVMDKERTFMTGVPCDLYFFDSDMQLHEDGTADSIQHYAVAHYHIISLWEELYVSLYSSRAVRVEKSQRSQQVSRLHNLFRAWGFKYKALLRAGVGPEEGAKDCFQLELKYCFHIGQILIHHCGREESNKEQSINSMYFALNLIQEVYRKRLFHCYPFIAFLDLYAKILQSPNCRVETDLDLLTKTADALSLLKDPSTPQAYYSKLHLGMTWCIQVASRLASSIATAPKTPSWEPSSAKSSTTNDTRKTQNSNGPSLSTVASSTSFAPPRMVRAPPPEDSPRPRKKSLSSQVVNAQVIPWAQKQIRNSTMSGLSGNTRDTNAIQHDDPLFLTMPEISMPSLSTDSFDWGDQLLNGESMLPELSNIPDLISGVGSQDSGMSDIIIPEGGYGMGIDPWDMDF